MHTRKPSSIAVPYHNKVLAKGNCSCRIAVVDTAMKVILLVVGIESFVSDLSTGTEKAGLGPACVGGDDVAF